PFPNPSNTAQPNAPTVNGRIEDDDIRRANGIIPANTPQSTRAPPMRSESHPPTGRISAAKTTKPAVRNPASPSVSWNWSRNSNGRYTDNATNPPNVRK